MWLFQQAGIETENFTFIDEIDLDQLLAQGHLRLVLMDHNKLSSQQKHFADVVEEIIDHHHNENLYSSSALRRVIEPVGSASTLVADEFLHSELKETVLDADLALLLLSPILLDTINLDSSAGRFNEKDINAAQELKDLTGSIMKSDELFKRLQEEKFNVELLSSGDLLRKDYKEWSITTTKGRLPLLCRKSCCCDFLTLTASHSRSW